MQFLTCDVNTYCIGMAASMGAVLLCAGHEGQAFRAAELGHHDPPGLRRRAGPGQRRGAQVEYMFKLKKRLITHHLPAHGQAGGAGAARLRSR